MKSWFIWPTQAAEQQSLQLLAGDKAVMKSTNQVEKTRLQYEIKRMNLLKITVRIHTVTMTSDVTCDVRL